MDVKYGIFTLRVWLALSVLSVLNAAFSPLAIAQNASNPLTPAEQKICSSVSHCLDIVSRHGPTEFDYTVLAEAFAGFGTKGRNALLKGLRHKNTERAERIATVIYAGSFNFNVNAKGAIALAWTQNPTPALSNVMTRESSAYYHEAFIRTLNHESSEARQLSRMNLSKAFGGHGVGGLQNATKQFTPKPNLYPLLAKAVLDDPTPTLVALISRYPENRARPILERALRNESPEVVGAAYRGLFSIKPDLALGTLTQNIRGLKDGEEAIALSFGEMLSLRHKNHTDNFYMDYAKNVLTDKALSKTARMVGLHAVMMQSRPLYDTSKNTDAVIPLPYAPETHAILMKAVQAQRTIPPHYSRDILVKLQAAPIGTLQTLYDQFPSSVDVNKRYFIEGVSADNMDGKFAKDQIAIMMKALSTSHDWLVISLADNALAEAKVLPAKPLLRQLANSHPFSEVRFSALQALDAMDGQSNGKRDNDWLKIISDKAETCPVGKTDFKAQTRQVPYYKTTKIAYGYDSARPLMTTAVPTHKGWLAGYDVGEFSGGLVAYDNRTGEGELIWGQAETKFYEDLTLSDAPPNITALMPKSPVPIGQYSDAYWAVAANVMLGQSYVLSVNATEDGFEVTPYYRLPKPPETIFQRKDGSVIFGFGEKKPRTAKQYRHPLFQPPLHMSPQGQFRLACTHQANARPETKTTKVMP